MNRISRIALKSLLLGFLVEMPLAIWGYNTIGDIYSPAFLLAIIHAPAVILLTLLLKPLAPNPNDITFPMTAVFITQAILFSLLFFVILVIRNRRKARSDSAF